MSTTVEKTSTTSSPSFWHRFYTGTFDFDFLKHRRVYYIVSAVILAICAISIIVRGVNPSIEFSGGAVFQAPVTVSQNTVSEFNEVVRDTDVDSPEVQVRTIGSDTVRVQTRSLSDDEVTTIRTAIAEHAEVGSEEVTYSLIGPTWGKQITNQAIVAALVFFALVGVLIWIYFRDPRKSVTALIALAHDLLLTIGIYSLFGFTFSPATVTAILMILGYSLYDTVVVFDMVRDESRDMTKQKRTYLDAANSAINKVLARSINTTIIAVLPVAAIAIAGSITLGGEGPLADLGLAMLIGMLAGAYSSLFLATPLLADWTERTPEMQEHRAKLAKRSERAAAKAEAEEKSPDAAQIVPSAGGLAYVSSEAPNLAGDDVDTARVQPRKKTRSQRKK